jgi:hypothetical protein
MLPRFQVHATFTALVATNVFYLPEIVLSKFLRRQLYPGKDPDMSFVTPIGEVNLYSHL